MVYKRDSRQRRGARERTGPRAPDSAGAGAARPPAGPLARRPPPPQPPKPWRRLIPTRAAARQAKRPAAANGKRTNAAGGPRPAERPSAAAAPRPRSPPARGSRDPGPARRGEERGPRRWGLKRLRGPRRPWREPQRRDRAHLRHCGAPGSARPGSGRCRRALGGGAFTSASRSTTQPPPS